MAAVFRAATVRLHNHSHRIPAYVRLNAPFKRAVARVLGLLRQRDGIQVSSVLTVWQIGARAPRMIDDMLDQIVRALRPGGAQNGVDRLNPLLRLQRIRIVVSFKFGQCYWFTYYCEE